jgi:hypothetical protein
VAIGPLESASSKTPRTVLNFSSVVSDLSFGGPTPSQIPDPTSDHQSWGRPTTLEKFKTVLGVLDDADSNGPIATS